jgi:Protein of unknown function DUF262/Protein of unknown function (DUF1524)
MSQIGLGGVLKQFRLVVPPNQREYSWEEEVTTLFQDLTKAILDGEGEYFLGTVVTIPRKPELLEIVDGQQRLATTAILLAEIRNYLLGREDIISESITNDFLTVIDRDKRERVAKLQMNSADNEYFRAMITKAPSDPAPDTIRHSHELLALAFGTARTHVKTIVAATNPKDHGDVLNRWISFIEHGAQVILLRVPSDVNAYKMFETLNDRGLKTSQSDLVKNYLLGESGPRLGEAQEKWALMRGALESLEEEDITVTFLRHALIAMRGHLREPEVYEAVQKSAKGSQAAAALLSTLESLANTYVAIFNPEHEKWNGYPDSIRRSIQALNLFNIRPMRPLMLAVAARFSEKETAAAFQTFISWSVRLVIASSTRSGAVEEPLSAAAEAVFSRIVKDTKMLKERLRPVIPNDEQFKPAFEFATVSKASLARYYLRSLERTAKNEPAPWFVPNDDQQVINLEHVLPIHREGHWPQFDEEASRAYVKRLGNMALLLAKSNSDLQSLDFEAKKASYSEAPYELTRQISDVVEWAPSSISERQKGLAALALKTWPL